jgi:hypothetical protein
MESMQYATPIQRIAAYPGAYGALHPVRRLPLSGYAVQEEDASHWACVIRTSCTPWKPWSIR